MAGEVIIYGRAGCPFTDKAIADYGEKAKYFDVQADSEYLHDKQLGAIFGGIQVLLLIIQVFISVYKPWGKRGAKD